LKAGGRSGGVGRCEVAGKGGARGSLRCDIVEMEERAAIYYDQNRKQKLTDY